MTDDSATTDPISWLMIQPGWKVVCSDGSDVGDVSEIVGDDTEDIFDGLSVATSALGKPRYVPAEVVGTITDGVIHLDLSREQADQLEEFLEPATSAEIEPDGGHGMGEALRADMRKLEGNVMAPIQDHEHPASLWDRIMQFFRR